MRRYFRGLWDAICGRRIAEVELGDRLRISFRGHMTFDGRVVGYQTDHRPGLGGATATVMLDDRLNDLTVLASQRRLAPHEGVGRLTDLDVE